jgi:hypothetical protein
VTFSELSEIINLRLACQPFYFALLELFIAQNQPRGQQIFDSHSTKYQNIVTLEKERGALSSW